MGYLSIKHRYFLGFSKAHFISSVHKKPRKEGKKHFHGRTVLRKRLCTCVWFCFWTTGRRWLMRNGAFGCSNVIVLLLRLGFLLRKRECMWDEMESLSCRGLLCAAIHRKRVYLHLSFQTGLSLCGRRDPCVGIIPLW